MAVSAYIGLPGSGKSYEVVRSVILPALASGRRIVTNIYGIHHALCRDFIIAHPAKYPCKNGPGDIIHVTNEQVNQPDFFPDYDDADKFCKHGDLILLDEVHRFFGARLSKQQENFIAEHRHYADAQTGVTCDLVIVTQALTTLPRFLRDRIDTVFRMKKLSHIGLSRRYRVDVYSTGRTVKSNIIRSYQEKYWPAVFTLYESNTVRNASEVQTDDRANMLRGKKFILAVTLLPLLFGLVVVRIWLFFHPSSATSAAPVTLPASVATAAPVSAPVDPDWCISGTLFVDGHNFVVLTDDKHHIRLISRQYFTGDGSQISGIYEGRSYNSWSCAAVVSATQAAPSVPLPSLISGGVQ